MTPTPSIRVRASGRGSVPFVWIRALCLSSLLFAVLLPVRALAEEEEEPKSEECMECHEDADDEFVEFPDGSKLSIGIDSDAWKGSIHAKESTCRGCHKDIVGDPHPDLSFKSAREYQVAQVDTCRRCHYAHYTRVVDGTHWAQLQAGNPKAPTCVDCHGAHDIVPMASHRADISKRCGRCHQEIGKAYEDSVHGRAVVGSSNPDMPVCTDCHAAHANKDPRSPGFHAASHEICAKCHSDEEKMKRYGLSPRVVSTYLDDFHGASNQLYALGAGKPGKPLATCTDCHGVHDVEHFDGEGGTEAVRERVVAMCKRCHGDVPDGFADAWMSHYEPTIASAPLVWAVVWGYRILIPMILLGLVLHILLHLWRVRFSR